MNWPDCYVDCKGSGVPYHNNNNNNKEDNIRWFWDYRKSTAIFHFAGSPLNIKYDYLYAGCYYYLVQLYKYMKIIKPLLQPYSFLFWEWLLQNLINSIWRKCLKVNASYKLMSVQDLKGCPQCGYPDSKLLNLGQIKMNADIAFQNAADTWKQGLEKIKQVPETIKKTLE